MDSKRYYSVGAETEVGKKLKAFFEKCCEVDLQTKNWVRAQGADEYIESPFGLIGGVAALYFKGCKEKEGYEAHKQGTRETVFVPLPDSELEKEMLALPMVKDTELISILKFKPHVGKDGKPLPFTFGGMTPTVFPLKKRWYFAVPYECEVEGLKELTPGLFERRKLQALAESR